MNVINVEAPEGTSVNLATADQALVVAYTKQALTGILVTTSNNAKVELKNGATGDVIAAVAASSPVGHTVNCLDAKFPDGIYVDAGGSATGVITVVHWSYIKGIT